ncbi:MAG: nitroreductase [Pseudomonadota bacterium]
MTAAPAAPGQDSTAAGMTAIDLILTRRSTKAFDLVEPGPTEDELRTLLTAATRVPDHGKLTPWHIQVLDKEGQSALGGFLADLFAREIPEANEKQIAFERDRPQRSPLLLVVTYKPIESPKIPELEQVMSAGAVCTTILHAANALGYGAQWLTEWPAFRPEVCRFLGHNPDNDKIVGFIYVGTRAQAPTERPRPDLTEVTSVWTGPTTA